MRVLDPHAERTADERRERDPAPAAPRSRQGIGERQPQRKEEEDVHQHLPVELGLGLGSGERGEGGEDASRIAFRAVKQGCVQDCHDRQEQQKKISLFPALCSNVSEKNAPDGKSQSHRGNDADK